MKNLAVSFRVNNDQKELLNSIFKNSAELKYLKDIEKEDREKILIDTEVLFTWNPDRELKDISKDSLKNLKFVQLLSAGHDHIDFSLFPGDCKISNNKGAYSAPMAEHIIAMILGFYKRLFENHKKLSDGIFDNKISSRMLKGSVCGILGFGGIGKAAAQLLQAFGTKIYAINSSGKTDEKVDFAGTLSDLEYVLRKSDIVIISIPLSKETNGLINNSMLELMKPDAVLINVARGEIIVEKDLYEHLKSHPEFSAGIDAWWVEPFISGEFKLNYPFFELPNLLGSPHNSAIVPGIFLEATRKAAEKILKYIEGEQIEIVNKEK